MTINTLLLLTFALMGEDVSTSYYDDMIMPLVNYLHADLFNIENGLRADDNQLTKIPYYYDRTETLVYNDVLIRVAIPSGLAAMLFLVDDEYKKSCIHQAIYDDYKVRYANAKYVDTNDYYSDTKEEE